MSRTMREEQDQAYNEAVRQDEERERERADALASATKAEEEARQQRISREKQIEERKARIAPEPEKGATVARILVRTLDGGRITRRFLGSAYLQSVFEWVDVASPDPLSVCAHCIA